MNKKSWLIMGVVVLVALGIYSFTNNDVRLHPGHNLLKAKHLCIIDFDWCNSLENSLADCLSNCHPLDIEYDICESNCEWQVCYLNGIDEDIDFEVCPPDSDECYEIYSECIDRQPWFPFLE